MRFQKNKYKSTIRASKRKPYTYDESLKSWLAADIYNVVLNPSSQLTYQYMANVIYEFSKVHFNGKNIKDIRILDWGCGKAQLSYFLHIKGFSNITVAEIKDYPHKKLWEKIDAKQIILDDPIHINAESGKYDIIISAGVLEHVPYDQSSIRELQRIMAPNGAFVCFNLPSRLGYIHKVSHFLGDDYHDRLYSKKEVKFLLKRSGLKPVVMYRRQLFPKKALNYKNPGFTDRVDNMLSIVPIVNLSAASIEFIAINQNCHQQDG